MPENTDSSTPSTRTRRARKPSVAPRAVVLGLDRIEWGMSIFGASIAMVLALVTAIEWIRNVAITTTQKFIKGKTCLEAYPHHAYAKHVGIFCEHVAKSSRSTWEVKFFFIFLIALCILYFTLRRKRAGVACFSIFLGLALGLGSGLVFFFLGAWLILRAYRLQKYGSPTFFGSNRVAKEVGEARRQERRSGARPSKKGAAEVTGPSAPEASKRYTPKKPPRKR